MKKRKSRHKKNEFRDIENEQPENWQLKNCETNDKQEKRKNNERGDL